MQYTYNELLNYVLETYIILLTMSRFISAGTKVFSILPNPFYALLNICGYIYFFYLHILSQLPSPKSKWTVLLNIARKV